jgi:limonene-1,2-epoxide hydrolase
MDRRLPPLGVVLSFIDCINRGDLDGLARLMSDEHRLLIAGVPPVEGREANVKAWRAYMTSFPGYVIHPQRLGAKGSRVAVLGATTGSHLELSDEEELRMLLIWVGVVVEGRVASWELLDDTEERRAELGLG